MNVLITHQFNSQMQNLPEHLRQEVLNLFNFASTASRDEIVSAPFVTNIVSPSGDIFTMLGNNVRIFCSFSSPDSDDLLFLDVSEAKLSNPSLKKSARSGDTSLFNAQGKPVAYISDGAEQVIYIFNGLPVAYIDSSSNVYGFNGKHLGWFENDILWDHQGGRIGFTKSTYQGYTSFEPFKGFKQFKPFKAYTQYAPYKPYKGLVNSSTDLENWLMQGR
ncbi:4-fold beta flower protein [Vibrio sp. FF145]|uniref:4-fold beta flower protein n=1 Tax=Vibrio sp. FF145 TaxID=3230013 RepID=UPI00352DC3DF